FVDGEDIKQLLEEIRDVIPDEIRQAKAIVDERDQIISQAQHEADTIIRVADEKAKAMVNQDEIVRQAQAKANDLILQGQNKYREMRKATSDYVDDIMRRTDEALAETLSELRKTRQNIKATQKTSQN
ncbi:MAG: ATPase, partial [Clostridia bacterium]|nr:ATPase [Clostridia bacterium]